MINIKGLHLNNIEIEEKSRKHILIHYIAYVTVKDLSYVTINSVNTLYLINNKMKGYIKESIGNKYLMQVSTDESKGTLKSVKDYGAKLHILLDQQLITEIIMARNL